MIQRYSSTQRGWLAFQIKIFYSKSCHKLTNYFVSRFSSTLKEGGYSMKQSCVKTIYYIILHAFWEDLICNWNGILVEKVKHKPSRKCRFFIAFLIRFLWALICFQLSNFFTDSFLIMCWKKRSEFFIFFIFSWKLLSDWQNTQY